jgi:type II secretory pathway pseudopilin PulG
MVLTRRAIEMLQRFLAGSPRHRSPRSHPELGMSLIEVLVAVLIMTVIALGIVPLFMRSIRQNREGANYTEVTNVGRSALEEFSQLDFNAPELTIAAGNDLRSRQVYDRGLERWVDSTAGIPVPVDITKPHVYERWITVEQFAAGDFTDDGYLDTPLAAGTDPTNVNIKRVRVMVLPLIYDGSAIAFDVRDPVTLEIIKGI